VIPTFEDLVADYENSGGRSFREKEPLFIKLLDEAWSLKPETADEPAVLFFVFCRHWMELAEHCGAFIDWLATSQLDRLGLPVKLDHRALKELRLDVCAGFADLDDVRAWFTEQYARQLD
jgi:hypothetical protein